MSWARATYKYLAEPPNYQCTSVKHSVPSVSGDRTFGLKDFGSYQKVFKYILGCLEVLFQLTGSKNCVSYHASSLLSTRHYKVDNDVSPLTWICSMYSFLLLFSVFIQNSCIGVWNLIIRNINIRNVINDICCQDTNETFVRLAL